MFNQGRIHFVCLNFQISGKVHALYVRLGLNVLSFPLSEAEKETSSAKKKKHKKVCFVFKADLGFECSAVPVTLTVSLDRKLMMLRDLFLTVSFFFVC